MRSVRYAVRAMTWMAAAQVCAVTAFAAGEVRVTGHRVNLRAAASDTVEVVGQVSDPQVLQVRDESNTNWLGVAVPPEVDLYVYAAFAPDGVVQVPKLQVRAGPGINYRVVDNLPRAAKVEVREAGGEWHRIAPTTSSVVWVHRAFVAPVGSVETVEPAESVTPVEPLPVAAVATPATPVAPEPTPEPPAVVAAEIPVAVPQPMPVEAPQAVSEPAPLVIPPPPPETRLPAELAGHRLLPDVEQGRSVHYEGVVVSSRALFAKPSRYLLEKRDAEGRRMAACYLLGEAELLRDLRGSRARVIGREYLVDGLRYSVLDPDQIIRVD